jgi:predicted Zn-dependent protease
MSHVTDKGWFESLAAALCVPVEGADRVTLYLKAEDSDFIRFNHGAVRQATHVSQAFATLAVVRGAKRIESTATLCGRLDADRATLLAERGTLLSQLDDVPDDPFLLLPDEVSSSSRHDTGTLPAPEALVAAVARAAQGLDFVGFYAGGPVVRAFADSRGQRHWHHVESFHIDWCLYQQAD